MLYHVAVLVWIPIRVDYNHPTHFLQQKTLNYVDRIQPCINLLVSMIKLEGACPEVQC